MLPCLIVSCLRLLCWWQLLSAIESNDREVSPSMLYAAAALLEGCSFVNGGSQNTMCGALLKLAEVRPSSNVHNCRFFEAVLYKIGYIR